MAIVGIKATLVYCDHAPLLSVFYAGTENAGIYESSDGGKTWQQLEREPLETNRVTLDRGTLWIGAQKGVFKRTLGGLVTINSGLPNERFDPIDVTGMRRWVSLSPAQRVETMHAPFSEYL